MMKRYLSVGRMRAFLPPAQSLRVPAREREYAREAETNKKMLTVWEVNQTEAGLLPHIGRLGRLPLILPGVGGPPATLKSPF